MAKSDKNSDKTNAMRLLEAGGVEYRSYDLCLENAMSASDMADRLGVEHERVFKTLVTVGKSGEHYVFIVPSVSELDLKKAAKVTSEKFIEMIPQKQLLPLTGYIHGGCSPLGMKKLFPTFIDESAILYDTIFFSAGKIGRQIECSADDLAKVIELKFEDVTV